MAFCPIICTQSHNKESTCGGKASQDQLRIRQHAAGNKDIEELLRVGMTACAAKYADHTAEIRACGIADTEDNRRKLRSVPISSKSAQAVFGLEHKQSKTEPGSLQRTRNGKVKAVKNGTTYWAVKKPDGTLGRFLRVCRKFADRRAKREGGRKEIHKQLHKAKSAIRKAKLAKIRAAKAKKLTDIAALGQVERFTTWTQVIAASKAEVSSPGQFRWCTYNAFWSI